MDDIALAKLIIENVRTYGIVGIRPDGVITAWSRGAEAITGYTRDEAVGMNFRRLFTESDVAAGMAEMELAVARSDGRAEDSRWHQGKDGRLFWANGMTLDVGEDDLFVKIFRDETSSKEAELHRTLLLNELNHRVKNTLATVQSVAEQALRSAGVDRPIRDDLTNRFMALSRAHNVLVEDNWAGADLRALICEVIAPYEREPSPFLLTGPPVRLHPSQAVSLSLGLHELTTNAVKYGALSAAAGRVSVTWNLAENGDGKRFLTLLWSEADGPIVAPPTRQGFGTKLISKTFTADEGSRAEVLYPPEGARCSLFLPLHEQDALVVAGSPAETSSAP